jgi:hypothetical protein
MRIPDKLDEPEQKLAYVVGVVTGHFTQMEDATNSVLRALRGDFSLAVGSPEYESISTVIDDCKALLKSDPRMAAVREDALSLFERVTESSKRRNDLVHRMWVAERTVDGLVEYRMLQDIYEHEQSSNPKKRRAGPKGRTIDWLAAVDDRLRHMQRSMNNLWYAVIRLSYWHDVRWTPEISQEMKLYREMTSGRFDLSDEGAIRLVDRDLAAALQLG